MTTIKLVNAWMLYALIPLAIYVMWMLWRRYQKPLAHPAWHPWAIAISLALAITAAARPQLGKMTADRAVRRGNVVFMIDISRSMLAEDISPSRLEFTKIFLRRLMERLPGARVALFPFTEFGYLQMPLTSDFAAADDFLSSLATSSSTSQGTDFTRSLNSLFTTLTELEAKVRDSGQPWATPRVVLLSDGETHKPLEGSVLTLFRDKGISVFTVGVATAAGGTIPVEGRFGGFKEMLRDGANQVVRTKLDPKPLERISNDTGGLYYPAQLDSVIRLGDRLSKDLKYSNARSRFQAQRELFPLLFVLALVFLIVELLSRGWRVPLRAVVLVFLLLNATARSESITEEHERAINQAGKERARVAFNFGVVESEKGNLQEAYELFLEATREPRDKVLRKKAFFNLGNTLLQLGDPAQALHAYQAAIDLKSGRFDSEADQKISENIVLAAKLHEQMKQAAKSREGKEENEGQQKGPQKDPGGSEKDYVAEKFSEEQREKIYKLMTSSEQQTLQQIQERKIRKNPRQQNGEQW